MSRMFGSCADKRVIAEVAQRRNRAALLAERNCFRRRRPKTEDNDQRNRVVVAKAHYAHVFLRDLITGGCDALAPLCRCAAVPLCLCAAWPLCSDGESGRRMANERPLVAYAIAHGPLNYRPDCTWRNQASVRPQRRLRAHDRISDAVAREPMNHIAVFDFPIESGRSHITVGRIDTNARSAGSARAHSAQTHTHAHAHAVQCGTQRKSE